METVARNELGGPYFNFTDIRIQNVTRFIREKKERNSVRF